MMWFGHNGSSFAIAKSHKSSISLDVCWIDCNILFCKWQWSDLGVGACCGRQPAAGAAATSCYGMMCQLNVQRTSPGVHHSSAARCGAAKQPHSCRCTGRSNQSGPASILRQRIIQTFHCPSHFRRSCSLLVSWYKSSRPCPVLTQSIRMFTLDIHKNLWTSTRVCGHPILTQSIRMSASDIHKNTWISNCIDSKNGYASRYP